MPKEAAKAIDVKPSKVLFNTNWSIPLPIPSEILPRIARGPITKINDADTNPSTNVDSSDFFKFDLSLNPIVSSRSSIFSQEPINAPYLSVRNNFYRNSEDKIDLNIYEFN